MPKQKDDKKKSMQELLSTDFRFLVITGNITSVMSQYKSGDITKTSGISTDAILHFSKISGIEYSIDYEEIAEGGKNEGPHILTSPHKKHAPLVLERGIISSNSMLALLRPGMKLGTWLNIILLDSQKQAAKRMFWITDGIVTKWETGGLDAMGNSILVEKFEILHDGIHYV